MPLAAKFDLVADEVVDPDRVVVEFGGLGLDCRSDDDLVRSGRTVLQVHFSEHIALLRHAKLQEMSDWVLTNLRTHSIYSIYEFNLRIKE